VKVEHMFACESETQKAAFIRDQGPEIRHIFRDMSHLAQARAYDILAADEELVPQVDLFLFGFVCKDKSKLNRNRGALTHCIQEEGQRTVSAKDAGGDEEAPNKRSESGATFEYVKEYLMANQPPFILGENVPEIGNKKHTDAESDLDYVKRTLTEVGYDITVNVYRAEEFGSLAIRPRLFIRGVLKRLQGAAKLEHCHIVMNEMRIPQIDPTIIFGSGLRDLLEIDITTDWKTASNMKDPKFRDEHLEVYIAHEPRLDYPPNYLSIGGEPFQLACNQLEERARELVAYCELTEPWPTDAEIEFMDTNLSLRYLRGPSGARRAWSTSCPCLAASSKIFVRAMVGGEKFWALLPGVFLMRIIGYPVSSEGGEVPSDNEADEMWSWEDKKLMTSLAGNAFSGFCVGPLLIGFLSAMYNSRFATAQ
ncbi:unnamed protein product, partial [Prorocentrum cordatum]